MSSSTSKRTGAALAALLLSLMLLCAAWPRATRAVTTALPASATSHAPTGAGRLAGQFGELPLSFEANAGQADARVRFLSRGARHTLLLGAGGASLALLTGGGERRGDAARALRAGAHGESALDARAPAAPLELLRMKFVGADESAEVVGEGELKARVNYFIGADPSKWRTGVPTYARVRYRELYRGVDLVYRDGGRGRLEYDFVLAPGADYRSIRLRFEGADEVSVGPGGELLLKTGSTTVRQSPPFVYQEAGGVRRAVEGSYVVSGGREVGFRLGAYDPAAPLVIDPVLVYSTYIPEARKISVDASGSVYFVGTASTFDLPAATPGAFQKTLRGDTDVFVAKLDASGTELSYLTYLGGGAAPGGSGTGGEDGEDIAVDAAGNAYVTGLTYSQDFPVVNAFQPAPGGGPDGFVSKLNPSGSALVYSSYLGGKEAEWSSSIAVDAAGAAYVLGDTSSTDFPVKNALQPSKKGIDDFFVTKVAPTGSSLEYSTYLGGNGMEVGFLADIAVDAAGAAYVGGSSYSSDYPVTPGAFQPATKTPAGDFNSDIVLTKIAPAGSSLEYSTYLGGTGIDFCYGIAVDAAGQVHVVGVTTSNDFPTQNALYPTSKSYDRGFLSKLNATGTALVYSTNLGGTQPPCFIPSHLDDTPFICDSEAASAVATDAAGNAYVTGYTISQDFPAPVNALQPALSGSGDAYVIKLSPAGAALFSTYFGGSSSDGGADIHADAAGTIYLLGGTSSDDLPVVNAYRKEFPGDADTPLSSFVAKISDAAPSGQNSSVRFGSASYTVDEAGRSLVVNVTREGDLSQAVSVDYSTGDRTASERSDYTMARGTLRFAPGEGVKTFSVYVTSDTSVEGDETFGLTLHDLRGPAVLAAPASAVVTVRDDDAHPTSANPIDDSAFFVRQHYLDFLGREPDAPGLQFWTNEIEQCGADAACREVKRINVSAAFFLSIEFQETGFLVERLHRLAFGETVPYRTFALDAHTVGEGVVVGQGDWQRRLDSNRRAYAQEFVTRAAFRERFPESLTPAQYVERLDENSGGSLTQAERAALAAALEAGTETRASVLLRIADDEDFRRREFGPAFVLMQYLGYLRRDPEAIHDSRSGYNFWLDKLRHFGDDWRAAELVKAFISSIEYRGRFNQPAREVALGQPFTLRYGETALVQPEKLRLSLLDVRFDTRCPRGTTCSSPGSVTILLQAVKAGGETARLILRIEGGVPRPYTSNPPLSILGYKFRLLQLDPEPPYDRQTVVYEALLQVDKD